MNRENSNKRVVFILVAIWMVTFGTQNIGYAQEAPTITASVGAPLTEATLNESVVTLTLSGGRFARSIFDIRDAVSVSGINGITIPWHDPDKKNDTQITIELEFNGDFDTDAMLTFTVGADAIANYNGPSLTAEIRVTGGQESVVASTAAPLTEATLNESVVTLTLSGGKFARSIFDIRDAVSVSGIRGVSMPWHQPDKKSDTEITIELEFDGNIDTDSTLTFTIGADAIANYNGPSLTAEIRVTGGQESVVASTAAPLTEATLNESVVTLTLSGGKFARSIFDIRDAVSVSGIRGVSMPWHQPDKKNDTEITIELEFDGSIDTDSTLTFTVGADAIANYNGPALTAQVSVTTSVEQVEEEEAPEPPQQETPVVQVPEREVREPPQQETDEEDTTDTEDTPDTFGYILGPWLWMIAKGSDIDADYLSTVSNGEVSEALVSINGVRSGDTLGDLQWTPETITTSVHCATEWWFIIPVHRCKSNNVQHVVNAAGLSAVQDLDYYTAYAFMNIISQQAQTVKMGVGSDDAVKVWLNGVEVHRNNVDRKTSGIQDTFRVNLKAGNNPLLVKVNDNRENWGMFFKIYLEPTAYTTSIYMTGTPPSVAAYVNEDVNEDGQVDIHDLILVIRALGQTAPVNSRVDVNSDGRVDKADLLLIVENLDDSAVPAAPLNRVILATLEPEILQAWIHHLRLENDGSSISQKALALLKGLLAASRPEQTALLANYPNPFNPETWIPYQLAKDADVTLRIYAVNGQGVRTLALGHQAAGMYQTRSRAAYWDGRNDFGEPVASGVYFYTLTAGDFTATRKMLIRK